MMAMIAIVTKSSMRVKPLVVFTCFVDLSKAFDTVIFWKLFSELEERGVAHNVV